MPLLSNERRWVRLIQLMWHKLSQDVDTCCLRHGYRLSYVLDVLGRRCLLTSEICQAVQHPKFCSPSLSAKRGDMLMGTVFVWAGAQCDVTGYTLLVLMRRHRTRDAILGPPVERVFLDLYIDSRFII